MVERGIATGRVSVEVSDPSIQFTLATATTLDVILNSQNRLVIMIDESSMLNSNLIRKINESKHLFICITRSAPFKLDYPLFGMYRIESKCVNSSVEFDIIRMDPLPLARDFSKKYDIVVESAKGRSEHELLSNYIDGILPSGGRDNIERVLRRLSGNVLVFADLGNIGKAYSILRKRCKNNKNIVFYPYVCFEHLLRSSELVKSIRAKLSKLNPFDVLSLEVYYEKLLEEETKGTVLEYKHGKKLRSGYFDLKVFDSKVGKGILEYINRFGKNEK